MSITVEVHSLGSCANEAAILAWVEPEACDWREVSREFWKASGMNLLEAGETITYSDNVCYKGIY